jgi:hypothetical protein
MIAESRPEPWETIEYRTRALAGYMEHGTYMQDDAGQVTRKFPPDEVIDLTNELRAVMYRPGAGTWFSTTITVTRSGQLSADFNYDSEPEWGTEPVPEAYAQDIEKFPRDESAVPDWLQQRLAEARSAQ